jgi:hypothetical protein
MDYRLQVFDLQGKLASRKVPARLAIPGLGPEGREFESRRPDHYKSTAWPSQGAQPFGFVGRQGVNRVADDPGSSGRQSAAGDPLTKLRDDCGLLRLLLATGRFQIPLATLLCL